MTRARIIAALVGVALVALIAWVASNTYWGEVKVPMPPTGEALTNPFYAVQRFAEALGARTAWDRILATPPSTDSVIVLSAWHWNLIAARRDALEHWVESGGRLVVDRTLTGGEDEFEHWSGIVRGYRVNLTEESVRADREVCGRFREERKGIPSSASPDRYSMCDLDGISFLTSNQDAVWALRDASGIQAIRVAVGRGRVTVINTTPFRERNLFDGDHGWLFTAATEMRRGDEVHFMSEDAHPSLLALLWQHGAPVVMLTLALVALVLWRGGVRFGPFAAARDAARRSLVEQIRGTGQFVLRHGGDRSLHAASLRALDEAAARRVPSYATLSADQRAAALARITGLDGDALAGAVQRVGVSRANELRNAIALLEAARRRTLIDDRRFPHARH